MEPKTKQADLEGEELDPQVQAYRRTRPSMRIETSHFVLKTNAKVIRNTRKKENAGQKFWDKVKPKKSARHIPEGAYEEEGKEIVSAAMHMSLPDHDEDWVKVNL